MTIIMRENDFDSILPWRYIKLLSMDIENWWKLNYWLRPKFTNGTCWELPNLPSLGGSICRLDDQKHAVQPPNWQRWQFGNTFLFFGHLRGDVGVTNVPFQEGTKYTEHRKRHLDVWSCQDPFLPCVQSGLPKVLPFWTLCVPPKLTIRTIQENGKSLDNGTIQLPDMQVN